MRPHDLIHSIPILAKQGVFHDLKLAALIADIARSAVAFDFGRQSPIVEMTEFAADMIERNLFTMPYDVVATCFINQQNGAHGMMIIGMPNGETPIGVMCTEIVHAVDGANCMPVGLVHDFNMRDGNGSSISIQSRCALAVKPAIIREMYGFTGDEPELEDKLNQRLSTNLAISLGFVASLMSRDVRAVHTPAPERLNKARAAKGKPPIGDSYVVTIGRSSEVNHADGTTSTHGDRKSPRMHWRRGHARVLNRGSETEKVLRIAPMLVSADAEYGKVKPKEYRVRETST